MFFAFSLAFNGSRLCRFSSLPPNYSAFLLLFSLFKSCRMCIAQPEPRKFCLLFACFYGSCLCLLVLLTQANSAKPSPSACSRYTRLFFGGRHPLCGIGVTSLINVISKPAAWIALIAVSLPDPGPLMCTSTFFIP